MAAGNTYTPLATNTLATDTQTITFSSISGSYTDLVIVGSVGRDATGGSGINMRYNGDTATNYSYTILEGNGTSATSNRGTSTSLIYVGYDAAPTTTVGELMFVVNIMNYSNSTTYKTCIERINIASVSTEAIIGLWRSTAAITSVSLFLGGTVKFKTGSTFTLYGILAA